MSIASRTTSIIGHIEEDYNALERLGADLTNVDKNIENIASVVNDIYDKLPKVTGTGSDLSLTPTLKGALSIVPIGNCEQDSTNGNQLIPFINQDFTVGNVRFYVQSGELYINGTANSNIYADNTNFKTNFKFTLQAGTYNFVRDTTIAQEYIKRYSDNTTLAQNSGTFTLTEETEVYYSFYITNGTSFENINEKVRLGKGSSILPYEPYTNGASPNPSYPRDIKVVTGDNQVVVQNKNILDLDKSEANGINSSGQNVNVDRNWRSNAFITIKPNTNYIFSVKSAEILRLYEYDENGNFISPRHELSNADTSLSITTYQNAKYLKWTIFVADQQTVTKQTIINLEPQIEQGSTATSYVAHQEQSTTLHLGSLELCKIGDYQDVITGSKDNWKVVRNIGKVVLNGSENWGYNGALNFIKGYDLTISSLPNVQNTDNIKRIICDKFNGTSSSIILTGVIYTIAVISRNRIYLSTDTTFEGRATYIKNWLSNNNITCYYQLAEPTEETITDTSLVQSLNELNDLMSYDGTTNIVITSNSANAQLTAQISALKGE